MLRYLHRCAYCPKNFATADMLKAHCSKVHGNSSGANSYDCKVCNLKFISFSGLSRHLKTKHGIRGDGGGGGSQNGGASKPLNNFQSRSTASAAASSAVNVSSFTTPVTLDTNFHGSSSSSRASPLAMTTTENKTLSESDFLFGSDSPGVAGNSSGAADPIKCGRCFLFFDDPGDYDSHKLTCC